MRNTVCLLLAMAMMVMFGCETTRRASPLITEYDQADARAELEFWHGLAEQPVTTNNDAFHGLIEMANGTDPYNSYADRVNWLKDNDLLYDSFDGEPDEAANRGTVAYILVNALEIKGGVTMRVFGNHPRYATRELIYLEIMRKSTPQQGLSGIEFVGLVGRAQDYDRKVP